MRLHLEFFASTSETAARLQHPPGRGRGDRRLRDESRCRSGPHVRMQTDVARERDHGGRGRRARRLLRIVHPANHARVDGREPVRLGEERPEFARRAAQVFPLGREEAAASARARSARWPGAEGCSFTSNSRPMSCSSRRCRRCPQISKLQIRTDELGHAADRHLKHPVGRPGERRQLHVLLPHRRQRLGQRVQFQLAEQVRAGRADPRFAVMSSCSTWLAATSTCAHSPGSIAMRSIARLMLAARPSAVIWNEPPRCPRPGSSAGP